MQLVEHLYPSQTRFVLASNLKKFQDTEDFCRISMESMFVLLPFLDVSYTWPHWFSIAISLENQFNTTLNLGVDSLPLSQLMRQMNLEVISNSQTQLFSQPSYVFSLLFTVIPPCHFQMTQTFYMWKKIDWIPCSPPDLMISLEWIILLVVFGRKL